MSITHCVTNFQFPTFICRLVPITDFWLWQTIGSLRISITSFSIIFTFSFSSSIEVVQWSKRSTYRTATGTHWALTYNKLAVLWRACNLTAFIHSSTGPPVCFLSPGTRVQSPGGHLCETGILLLGLSRYIGDPDMIDQCGLAWDGLRPEPSLGCHADNVIIPLDLTQLLCPGFTLAAGPLSSFTTDMAAGGRPVESLQSHCIHTQFHWSGGPPLCFPSWGTRVQSP